MLVDLVEEVVSEQLDDVPVARLCPSWIVVVPGGREREREREWERERGGGDTTDRQCEWGFDVRRWFTKKRGGGEDRERTLSNSLWPFVDEAELCQKTHESAVFQLSAELGLQRVALQ